MANKYELKLRLDHTIHTKVRSLCWDLQNMEPGFIIQLHVHQVIQQQDQNNRKLRATNTVEDRFLHKQHTLLATDNAMFHFLSNTLSEEGVTVDTNGRFSSCDDGLHLLRHDSSRMLLFSPSMRVYTLRELEECVLRYFRLVSDNKRSMFRKRIRFHKLVPIAMDLMVVRYQQFRVSRVDDALLVRYEADEEDCAICLDKIVVGQLQLASCVPCAHVFHRKCIAHWLGKSTYSSCPLCRADLFQNC